MMQLAGEAERARAAGPQAAQAPAPIVSSVAEREARIVGSLMGNKTLMAGLGSDDQDALRALAEDAARRIVADTAGLDDAAAQDILQPRVRALRRLLYSLKDSAAAGKPLGPAGVRGLSDRASSIFGPAFRPATPEESAALCAAYNAAPPGFAARCALLHHFTLDHLRGG
jgi:hypothetical protein